MQIFYTKAWHVEAMTTMTSLQCNGGPTGGVTLFRGLFLSPKKNLAARIPEAVKKPFFVSVSSFEVYREVVMKNQWWISGAICNYWIMIPPGDFRELCQTGSCTKSTPATSPKPMDISWQSWVSEDFWQEAPFQVEIRSTLWILEVSHPLPAPLLWNIAAGIAEEDVIMRLSDWLSCEADMWGDVQRPEEVEAPKIWRTEVIVRSPC